MRVLVTAHYASEQLGGEGAIPLHYFRGLRRQGVLVWLLTHDSARPELEELLPEERDRLFFSPSLPGFGPVFTLGERMPPAPRVLAWGVTQLERQLAMVPRIRRLIRELAIDVVHQPISVSPTIPSPLVGLGVAVVMGPLNGGMSLPRGLRERDNQLDRWVKAARPYVATMSNALLRGRLEADILLVANQRTAQQLPRGRRGIIATAPDIGVALQDWPCPLLPADSAADGRNQPVTYLFIGRLVDWKGVDLLLDAFAAVRQWIAARLVVVGDGPRRAALEEQIRQLGLTDTVRCPGWLTHAECAALLAEADVFVFPSLQEAGGAAVLEAMASARPVVCANWGGPADFVDTDTGVLVPIDSRATFVSGLVDAMVRLGRDPALRRRLGCAARRRIQTDYDWAVNVDRMLGYYRRAIDLRQGRVVGRGPHSAPAFSLARLKPGSQRGSVSDRR